MAAAKNMKWLGYRRRRWLAAFFTAILAIVVWQVFAPRQVDVVIYNQTVRTLAGVHVVLGPTTVDYGAIESRHSVVRSLPVEARGELVLWLPGVVPERTAGPWVDREDAAQVVVRVGETGLVTFSVFPSWGTRMAQWLR